VIAFGWGAALLTYLTLQRIAELWWAGHNERALLAAGGVEYGRSHLPLIVLLHGAWLIGMWLLAYDRPIAPLFFAIVVILQIVAAVPLALGLPLYALAFSILNAAVLAIRIPAENAALAAAASGSAR
jgi:methyltransferase